MVGVGDVGLDEIVQVIIDRLINRLAEADGFHGTGGKTVKCVTVLEGVVSGMCHRNEETYGGGGKGNE